jgi:hypothetical protein
MMFSYAEPMIDLNTAISIIERRRNQFKDRASVGCPSDSDGGEAAQRAWEIAAEYDSLLAEINGESPT